jgi:hypothetical protein
MKVWGIDPSSKCGLAIWDTTADLSSVHCEVIENKSDRDYYFYSIQMGRKLRERAKGFGKPDLIVVEQGSESTQGTGISGIIWCWACLGAVSSIAGILGPVVAFISPASWRKPFYGAGFVCPQLPVMETVIEGGIKVRRQVVEKGKLKFKNDWKTAAIRKCEHDGVTLPPQKTIAHNAAEAVGIAHSWAHATAVNPEFHQAFIEMRKAWNAKPERVTDPNDLFAGVAA